MTAKDLIKSSLRLIGVIDASETPTAAEFADALLVLNDLLESWSTDGLIIPEVVREEFTVVPGQGKYTMGPAGEFDTVRPMRFMNAGMKSSGSEIAIQTATAAEFAGIQHKEQQSWLPSKIYLQQSSPLATVHLYPVPNTANTLVLYSLKQFGAYLTGNETVSLPPGYTRALRYNLALDLAPEFGKDPTALVAATAMETKAELKSQNSEPVMMISDVAGFSSNRYFDPYGGE